MYGSRRRAVVRPNSTVLAWDSLFSMLIPVPQPSQVRFEWFRKYAMGLQCPVPHSLQMTSMVTLSNAFFGI